MLGIEIVHFDFFLGGGDFNPVYDANFSFLF